jgi:hypothetical protein
MVKENIVTNAIFLYVPLGATEILILFVILMNLQLNSFVVVVVFIIESQFSSLQPPEKGINDGSHCAASSNNYEVVVFVPFRSIISDFRMVFLMNRLPSHCKPTGLVRLASFSKETMKLCQ